MANTSLQHSQSHCSRDGVCKVPSAGLINMKEVKVIGQVDREKRSELCEGTAPQIVAVVRNGVCGIWLLTWDFDTPEACK